MEQKKRVFIFYDGKGKPVFLKPGDAWNEFCQSVVKELFGGVSNPELRFENDKKEEVTTIEKLLSEKDPLIYVSLPSSGQSTAPVTSSKQVDVLSLQERKQKERLEQRKREQEQRELERKKREASAAAVEIKEAKDEAESQQRLTLEEEWRKEKSRRTEIAEEKGIKKLRDYNMQNVAKQSAKELGLSAFDKKLAALETFGEHVEDDEPREVRIFIHRLGGAGKPMKFLQNSPDFTLHHLMERVRMMLALEGDIVFYSVQVGRVDRIVQVYEDDILYVLAGDQTCSAELLRQVLKHKEDNQNYLLEKERKRLEEEKRTLELMAMQRSLVNTNAASKVANETFCCSICFDDVLKREVFVTHCGHRFCRLCIQQHIELSVNDNLIIHYLGTFGIVCPQDGCGVLLEDYEIAKLLPKPAYEKLTVILRDLVIDSARDMSWCPTPNCGNVVMKNDAIPEMVFCFKCKYCWCSSCRVQWHADSTCQQYRDWLKQIKLDKEKAALLAKEKKLKEAKEEDLTQQWLKRNARVCVKCNAGIEKNGGCNHMTCSRCHGQFCWICNKRWRTCSCPQFT